MKKNFHLLFWCLSLFLVLQLPVLAQDNSKEIAPDQTPVKTNLHLQTTYSDFLDLLYDNGPIITLPGGGCSGGDGSIVETVLGLTLYGWGAQQSLGNYMADDFISDADWNIDSMMFYSYQTGATTSTITGVYVQIWDASPMAGGTVIWGDLTTNLLQSTGLSNTYRALDTGPTDCQRRVQNVVATIGTNLPAGQYWVQWGFTGTASSGPWNPPVTIAGVTNTGDALQYTTAGGWALALNGTFTNGAPFMLFGTAGPPVGPGPATNPVPADGATDVDVNADLSWTNPAGATSIEVFFGPTGGSLTSVYSGAPVSSFDVGEMAYDSDYSWKVNETDGTGTTIGSTWSFTTMQNPNLVTLFLDDFEAGTGNWTITTASGCPWDVIPISSRSYTLPPTAMGNAFAADADLCGSSGGGSSSTAVLTDPIDATSYSGVSVEWDNDWQAINAADFAYLDVSVDGGTTWMNVVTFDETDVRNTHEYYDISSMVGNQSFMLRLVSVQPAWDWWWAIDNLQVTGWGGVNPPYVFSDNFDSYTAGQQLACQNPDDWTTWSLDPCNATEDAYISSNFAHSAPNSFVVVQNNDEVHYWGPETAGLWEIGFYNYIPSGKTGYFNTLSQFIGTQEWGLEVYLNAGGAGALNAGGNNAATFTWTPDTWVLNQVIVDLDNDVAEYWYNGVMIYQWQWTLGASGTPIALSLAANDFFGAAATDEMYVDDYYVNFIVPVEFTAFSAKADNGSVSLNWATATETNNKGFEVQRSTGGEFATIGFVNGNGTSTQAHEYSYVDNSVSNGQYSYRLKQVDFDGSFAYSQVEVVNVNAPSVYSLAQNYPNPFNPSTQINFNLASDSKVTLKIFDILGQEVVTLLNGSLLAGPHFVNFNASSLTSGVYLYRLDATGADGSKFTNVKKMLLTK